MTYRDQLLTCTACGKQFVYRVEEQRSQVEAGFEPEIPEKCENCREKRELGPGLHAGVVKWYRDDKHFGFITVQDGGDVFFHRSGVASDQEQVFQEGASVWFEVTTTDRGPQAINVHLRE